MDISNRKVNILHLITGLNSGGAERVVLDLMLNINKENFNAYLGSISDGVHMVPVFKNLGIEPTLALAKKSPISVFKAIRLFNQLVRSKEIDLVHAHMVHSMFIAFFLKLLNWKLKIVFTSHNINVESRLREILLWLIRPFRDYDIVFSERMNRYFFKKNRVVIPNGIKTSDYDFKLEKFEKFTFISIGRLEPQKNQKFLVEIASQLKNIFPFQILIVGKGYLETEISQEIEKFQVENEVKLLGFRRDIIDLCNKSHVFVMPSLWEGFPISLIEAGASGLPVITTDVGGISQLIDASNGYLTDLHSFKEVMEKAYNNYEEAVALGQELKKKIKEYYDISQICLKHEKLYLKCFTDANKLT